MWREVEPNHINSRRGQRPTSSFVMPAREWPSPVSIGLKETVNRARGWMEERR